MLNATLQHRWKSILLAFALTALAVLSSCGKHQDGYYIASKNVTRIIQINTDATAYSITSAPDIVTFTTQSVNPNLPNYRQYLLSGTSTNNGTSFTLSFHTDIVGSGIYVLDGSQFTTSSKTYISLAAKSTDRVSEIKIDDSGKVYSGNFSFYSFNKVAQTDSVFLTGAYSVK
ncbi:hypothetical protein BDD43_3480 [Mucilaginibacter gracilis]|uniref:Uncharacterized protein n=1 Tax=Mucilaginibacter gracilis TaxID=423350 RepID=A0A495J2R9_9SPHI|nr:hypothetical protein [Mucilaginibacter gracilis]RKR83276.1 hypothetical protein BDD43_3480 [Mucilaginibacter gracilis]